VSATATATEIIYDCSGTPLRLATLCTVLESLFNRYGPMGMGDALAVGIFGKRVVASLIAPRCCDGRVCHYAPRGDTWESDLGLFYLIAGYRMPADELWVIDAPDLSQQPTRQELFAVGQMAHTLIPRARIKPTFQEVEDSSIRERREVAAQVRSGSKATALEPAPEVAQDPRTPEEIAEAQEASDASHDAGASALVNTFDGDEAPELKDREPEAPQQLVNTFDDKAGREAAPKPAANKAAADEKAKK
jgi:hypothetical protein